MSTTLNFPDEFVWGTATASFQIEGSPTADGKGRSVWDDYAADPSRIADGRNADVTCDHYRRYKEDVALMKELGYPNYRLSLSWPRFFPEGTGELNRDGAAFYDRLVDELLEQGITPYVTLFHWDLPSALQARGGWADRATAEAYAAYADAATGLLGDRVKNWMTHNEPWVHAIVGHLFGHHAPGLRELPTALAAAHHILLSHGLALPIIRRNAGPEARAGIVHNLEWIEAASDSEADIRAAQRHDGAFNRWFLDPVFKGEYPADMLQWYGDAAPEVRDGDMDIISGATDFLGVNYYTRRIIADCNDGSGGFLNTRQVRWPFIPRAQYEEWENNPEGLYRLLIRLKRDYGNPPIFISENGTPIEEDTVIEGHCEDPVRIDYIRNHTAAAWQAMQDGSDIRGYFAWSFLDNFEWNFGFTKRFGLIHVDFDTGVRTVKDSGRFYSGLCRTGRLTFEDR